ncbi:hypothetical protein Bca4012_067828 [Brassica carinata]|uniref:Uncharacterized protein n=1 Tax=Brassica carinata TaxID=52824 RepID=A0A8X7VSR5_BRACI|nr:hypothetical protein Bca52824_020058 [Brassica carinata]
MINGITIYVAFFSLKFDIVDHYAQLIATGLDTTCFSSDHSMLPKLLDPDGLDESTVNVTEYDFLSFTSLKFKTAGSTEILTSVASENTLSVYDPAPPTFVTVRVYLYVPDPSTFTAKDG